MKKLVILVAILSVMFLGVTITSPTVAHAVPNVCAEHPEQPGCQGGGGCRCRSSAGGVSAAVVIVG